MNIRQLEYTYNVVKYQTMHKAAEKMYVTQPTISQQIKNLEKTLGIQLFKKEGRKLVLTTQGEEIFPYIENIVMSLENFKQAVQSVKNPSTGEISFGIKPIYSHRPIKKVLKLFNEKYPNICVNITESGSMELLKFLEKGEMDLIILNTNEEIREYMEENGIIYHTLSKSKFVLAVPNDHPLINIKNLSYKDIENESIMLYRGGLIESYVTRLFGEKYKKNIILSFVDYISITNLVRDGFGISIVPESHVKHWSDELKEGLTFLEFVDFGHTIEICLARKKKDFVPTYFREFIHLILDLDEPVT